VYNDENLDKFIGGTPLMESRYLIIIKYFKSEIKNKLLLIKYNTSSLENTSAYTNCKFQKVMTNQFLKH